MWLASLTDEALFSLIRDSPQGKAEYLNPGGSPKDRVALRSGLQSHPYKRARDTAVDSSCPAYRFILPHRSILPQSLSKQKGMA